MPTQQTLRPSAAPLDAEARATFDRDGFIVVRGAFARHDALALQDAWWAELAQVHGIAREDPSTWRGALDLKRAKISPSQRWVETERVRGVIDDLLGAGAWDWPKDWGRAIVTFPSGAPPEAWDVPTGWHWDSAIHWNLERLAGLFVVAFVGEVGPQGGGTAVIGGSPRFLVKQHRALAHGPRALGETWRRDRVLRDHPWLAALSGNAAGPADRIAAFMRDGGEADGVTMRVVELTGEPGDMVFCHPLLTHSMAPNCREVPRMMRIKQHFTSHEGRARAKREAAG
jgi:hypothetical protein